jgi:hypothetical protein
MLYMGAISKNPLKIAITLKKSAGEADLFL